MRFCRPRYLPVCALVVFALVWSCGALQPMVESDTASYLDFDFTSAKAMLSQTRTPLYPLFLNVIGVPNAPLFHAIAYLSACVLFGCALKQLGYADLTAFLCGVTLMLGRGLVDLAGFITADSLAISAAIATTACFLGCLRRQSKQILWWTGLAMLTLVTPLIRPAYLFMIPLWPVLGIFLDRYVLRPEASNTTRFIRAGYLIGVSVVPFLMWATLRLIIVGHWGLVAFGGYNLVGITGQFVDDEFAASSSGDVAALSRRIIDTRSEFDQAEPPDSFANMEAMYNPTVWQFAVPAANELTGEDDVATNHLLTELSFDVLLRYPSRYLTWLAWNANHARREITTLIAFDKGVLLLAALIVLAYVFNLRPSVRHPSSQSDIRTDAQSRNDIRQQSHLLFWTALGFLSAKTLLVMLVEPANSRYMIGASIFVPAVFAMWAAHYYEVMSDATGDGSPQSHV